MIRLKLITGEASISNANQRHDYDNLLQTIALKDLNSKLEQLDDLGVASQRIVCITENKIDFNKYEINAWVELII